MEAVIWRKLQLYEQRVRLLLDAPAKPGQTCYLYIAI